MIEMKLVSTLSILALVICSVFFLGCDGIPTKESICKDHGYKHAIWTEQIPSDSHFFCWGVANNNKIETSRIYKSIQDAEYNWDNNCNCTNCNCEGN
jgi:hypothetical protein